MRTALIKAIKDSMRMSTASAIIEDDISGCIEACFKDLQLAGVEKIDETDALIIRAAQLLQKQTSTITTLQTNTGRATTLLRCL